MSRLLFTPTLVEAGQRFILNDHNPERRNVPVVGNNVIPFVDAKAQLCVPVLDVKSAIREHPNASHFLQIERGLSECLDARSEKSEVNWALHRHHVSSVDPSFAVVGWFTICSREIAYSCRRIGKQPNKVRDERNTSSPIGNREMVRRNAPYEPDDWCGNDHTRHYDQCLHPASRPPKTAVIPHNV